MPHEIKIDGVIGNGAGEISSQWVKSQLPVDQTQPITVRIHSEGGSVFEGFAIYDAFKAYAGPKKAIIESSAFSIASFIPMAFDDVEITPNGYLMLHNPHIEVGGDDEELASKSQLLAQLKTNMVNAYAERTGKGVDEVIGILKRESYFNAEQAVANGLASRITDKPVTGRVFARLESMPHGVVAALFGADSGGDTPKPTENPMAEKSEPVAATVAEIKSAFPKAKAEFIVRCMERNLPLASVAAAAAEELMKENEELQAKVTALEEEMAKARAAAEEEEVEAAAEEEEVVEAKARARGQQPVARVGAGIPKANARVRWNEAVRACISEGLPRARAVQVANKRNPGLRQEMLSEVNAR